MIILASISASPLEGSIALFISQWIFVSAAHWLLKENMDRKLDMRYCLSLNVKQDFQQQIWHSFSGVKKSFMLNKNFECGLMWMSLVCVKNAAAPDNNFYNKCWCRALHATSVCTLQTYQLSIFHLYRICLWLSSLSLMLYKWELWVKHVSNSALCPFLNSIEILC